MVRRLPKVVADRRTGHDLEVALRGLEGLLVMGLKTGKQGGSPSNTGGPLSIDYRDRDREVRLRLGNSDIGGAAMADLAITKWLLGEVGPARTLIEDVAHAIALLLLRASASPRPGPQFINQNQYFRKQKSLTPLDRLFVHHSRSDPGRFVVPGNPTGVSSPRWTAPDLNHKLGSKSR